MELVLKNVDRKGFLAGADERKLEERKKGEGAVCNLTIYDPTSSSKEVADRIVLERLEELEKTKEQEEESEAAEREKFNKALTFTDIPATVKKAGFHSDGSPRVVVAGLFDKEAHLIREGKKLKYHSSLRVELVDVEIDKKESPCFFVAIALSIASFFIPLFTLSSLKFDVGILPDIFLGTIFGGSIPIILTFSYGCMFGESAKMELSPGNWIKVRLNISTPVPSISKCVLEEICKHGKGPFAILFEVTEGWQKIKSDPVILRVISIDGQQFFEAVIGYEMTPLEKSSLVPV